MSVAVERFLVLVTMIRRTIVSRLAFLGDTEKEGIPRRIYLLDWHVVRSVYS